MGDIHAGTKACEEHKLNKIIETIKKTPDCYWIGMGDYAEFINYSDKRFQPSILADWLKLKDLENLAKSQADWIIDKLKPIAKKCVGLLYGNHEETIKLKYHQDIHQYICVSLGLRSLEWACLMNLFFRPKNGSAYMLKMKAEHGHGGGYYSGGQINRAIMKSGECEADIYCSGHVHKKLGTIEVMIGSTDTENPTSKEKPKAVIITGSYLRTFTPGITTYAEKFGMKPVALGSPYLDVWQERKHSRNTENIEIKMELTL